MDKEAAKGFAGSITVFCGQVAACMLWVWLMAKNDEKNTAREK